MRFVRQSVMIGLLACSLAVHASIFGTVKGLVHDPQHRPISGAQITLKAAASEWQKDSVSDQAGSFEFSAVPIGEYRVTVVEPGFQPESRRVLLRSGEVADLHFALTVARVTEQVEVRGSPSMVDPTSSTPASVIVREEIRTTPGAERTNSLAMITDFVPGAYIAHDQLHVRGGHQSTWMLDGIPLPNTNIATNVGPQVDPKNIDILEVQRGGLSAEYGDRIYGVFNAVTRSGFESSRQCEVALNYGSYNQTDDQLSCGSHTERFAYFASLTGNRTDLGLETPSPEILHDQGSGLGGFASLIFNKTPADQLRLVAAVRGDHYQIPNTPQQQADGVRDVEDERDAFVNASWVHSTPHGLLITVAPFVHLNRAHYLGGPNDPLVSPEDNHRSDYFGGIATLAVVSGRHNLHWGFQGFAQNENIFFALRPAGPGTPITESDSVWGSVVAGFLEEQFKVTKWLTLNGGVRLTHFSGSISETAVDPRVGAAIVVPRLNWVVRGFYGRYYQPPPLTTVSGPLLDLALTQGFAFQPLRGERDEQYEFGVAMPYRGWTLDLAHFRTAARNFFDHDALGNSNIFLPLTIERARIRGWEVTLRSPRVLHRADFHLAYSHQWAVGFGAVNGGLIDLSAIPDEAFFLDHDQRHTLTTGVTTTLPWRAWASVNLVYGSGFLDGEGPEHLASHTTADLSLGKSIGESWSVQLTALNLTNRHYLLDNANTFGGTHYADPRTFSGQVRYTFHY
ncbi:MAG TPA: TonB-dependent receptor [Terriglobales bacterium]|nr:TonB-dependent receptor [Terriglobales bacterium]